MQEKYNTTYNGLKTKARDLKVNRRIPTLSNEDIQNIIQQYTIDNKTMQEIANSHSVSRTYIKKILLDNDVVLRNRSESMRKYNIDENFFSVIDSEEKAYFLGLLYADGYNNTTTHSVSISLHSKDIDILEKFKVALKTEDRPIRKYKNCGSDTEYCNLTIVNKILSKDLDNCGMAKAKSLILTFPEWLQEKLIRHFLRGYFDGDGHIGIYGNKIVSTMLGTNQFIASSIDNILKNIVELKSTSVIKDKAKPWLEETKILRISGGKNVELFLDYLYKDSAIYLQRKYDKYLKVKNREKDIWISKRKKYGENGRGKLKISEKALCYITEHMSIDEKIDKSRLFSEFIEDENSLTIANLSYHSRVLKELVGKKGIGFDIENGYRYIRKIDKTEHSYAHEED